MDYITEYRYLEFLESSMLEQERINRCIEEAIIITEGTGIVSKIRALDEAGAVDSIKAGFAKFKEFLAKIWSKFINNMTTLFTTDKVYLEKYKDTIIHKKMIDAKWGPMKDYAKGIERIATDKPFPTKDEIGSATASILDDPMQIQAKLITQDNAFKGVEDFSSYCKDYFMGGSAEREYMSTELNLIDMYNFCFDCKVIKNNIEKDRKSIEIYCDAMINEITLNLNNVEAKKKQYEREQQVASQQAAQTAAAAPAQPAAPAQQAKPSRFGKRHESVSSTFSYLYNDYITEVERTAAQAQATPAAANGTAGSVARATSGTTNDPKDVTSAKADLAASSDATAKSGEDVKSLEAATATMQGRFNNYKQVMGVFLAAKCTAVDTIYKEYMSIIRMHVKDQLNTKPADQTTVIPTASQYPKTQPVG